MGARRSLGTRVEYVLTARRREARARGAAVAGARRVARARAAVLGDSPLCGRLLRPLHVERAAEGGLERGLGWRGRKNSASVFADEPHLGTGNAAQIGKGHRRSWTLLLAHERERTEEAGRMQSRKTLSLPGLSLLTLDGSHFSNFLCFTMSERGTKRLREATLEERDGESAEECKGDEHGGRGESSEDDATDLADARAGDESDESDGGDGLGRDERDGSDSDVSEEEEEALFSACAAGDLTALNQLLESGQSDTSPHSSRTDTNPNCDNMSHLTTCHT